MRQALFVHMEVPLQLSPSPASHLSDRSILIAGAGRETSRPDSVAVCMSQSPEVPLHGIYPCTIQGALKPLVCLTVAAQAVVAENVPAGEGHIWH